MNNIYDEKDTQLNDNYDFEGKMTIDEALSELYDEQLDYEEMKIKQETERERERKRLEQQKNIRKPSNNNNRNKRKFTTRGKALIFAMLMGLGWAAKKPIEDIKYQIDIDKNNKAVLMLEPSDSVELSPEQRKQAIEFLTAAFEYKDGKVSKEEMKQNSDIIDNYVKNGDAINLAQKIMTQKLDFARRNGELSYENIDEKNTETEINFFKDFEGGSGFRIDGVKGETYSIYNLPILENKIPRNLKKVAKDCLKYRDTNWKKYDKDKRIKIGCELAEHIETMMNENYLMDENKILNKGIKRINDEDAERVSSNYYKNNYER